MNIGDRLYCHTNCVMKGGGETTTVVRELIKNKLKQINECRKNIKI